MGEYRAAALEEGGAVTTHRLVLLLVLLEIGDRNAFGSTRIEGLPIAEFGRHHLDRVEEIDSSWSRLGQDVFGPVEGSTRGITL